MKAFICDICKTHYKAEPRSTIGTNDVLTIRSEKLGKIDMCNACHDRLIKWVWKGEKLTRLGV